jgi:hypothetical protein
LLGGLAGVRGALPERDCRWAGESPVDRRVSQHRPVSHDEPTRSQQRESATRMSRDHGQVCPRSLLLGRHQVRSEHRYRLVLAGELSERAREAFEGWKVELVDAVTALIGDMDQAALHGVLAHVQRLGLDLVELRRLPPTSGEAVGNGRVGAPSPAPT